MPDIIDIPLCEMNEIILIIGNERNYTVYIGMTGLKELTMFVQLYRDNGLDGPRTHLL